MNFSYLLIFLLAVNCSCSTQKDQNPKTLIHSITSGLIKNNTIPFPLYLTDKLENRLDLEKKYSNNLFIIHTGHILKPELSKEENEKNLYLLSTEGFNLVNLTLEDFIVADNQSIDFEKHDSLLFLNSSIIDLNLDHLISAKNISAQFIFQGMAFIGLSDDKINPNLNKEKFIINDYVLSILKVKNNVLKTNPQHNLKSFIIVHSLGNEINDVMLRLPPSFINLLAD